MVNLRQNRSTVFLVCSFLIISFSYLGCGREEADGASSAEDLTTASVSTHPEVIERGEALFVENCQKCHGAEAEGFGEAVGDVRTLPPDLTQLSMDHGGEFPVDHVRRVIDGREDVEAHGPREMPVWGNVWAEENTETRIAELIAYLNSIQKGT